MGGNEDLVNYAKESAKLSKKNNQKPADKPRKCQYQNCPMRAVSTVEGRSRCSYHHTGDFHHEVTIAIKQNINFINGYNSMVKWTVSDWTKHNDYLLNNKNCPMEQGELPSMYLVRFFNWISEKIQSDATILVNQKLKGDQDETNR